MPEYLAPGVYVEEVSFRSKSIEGVGTSTTAFVGPAPRGPLFLPADKTGAPVPGVPECLTSFAEFERLHGGLEDLAWDTSAGAQPTTNYVAHAVKAFFDNGGSRLYFARTWVPGATDGIAASSAITGSVRFKARMPGSGGNGSLVVRERRSPASAKTLDTAPLGSLARMGSGNAATPARLESASASTGVFSLSSGMQLKLAVNLPATTVTIIVTGGPARALAADALTYPLTLAADAALNVSIDGRPCPVVVPANTYNDINDLLAVINPVLRGGSADASTGRIRISSDRAGSAAAVMVAACAELGFSAPVNAAGTGNVGDLNAVTVAELDGLLTSGGVRAALSAGKLVLVTVATGANAALVVDTAATGSMHAALGLTAASVPGLAGTTPQYYLKTGTGWKGGADKITPMPAGAADLVRIGIEARDAQGNLTVYEDLGLDANHPHAIGSVLAKDPSRRSEALANPYWLDLGPTPPLALDLREALLGSFEEKTISLTGGNDGVPPTATNPTVGAIAYDTALAVLGQVLDISIVAAPAHGAFASSYASVQQALITHAENLRYRFAVLDTPPAQTPSQARAVRSAIDTTRAALYYPWLIVANPLARPGDASQPAEITLPPSGFLCGIYARTDVTRGVWKAPANESVRGALRAEVDINQGVNAVLNPEGVNCLRSFPGRGLKVWGARTASSDPEWKYVNVRRYFIYLERSIDVSTQWAVFEPNGEALWANIRDTVDAFLLNEWRSGALLGSKPEEAYFVRCDRSTMTQNDLDNGRLICLIGVAPLRPAEFVIFRIGQKTADARS